MKRVLLTVALCVAASVSFAQKKAVNEAQSIAKGSTPDFSEARTLIKGALENPETKDDAKTWYVAGFIVKGLSFCLMTWLIFWHVKP